MHNRIATAIDELFGSDSRYLPELAFHTAEAAVSSPRLRPLAVERLRRAARESMSQLSFDEAAELLGRARELADADNPTFAAELALEHGIAQNRAGQSMMAMHTFSTAINASRASGNLRLRIEAALRFEDATWRPGLPGTQALEHLDEAIGLLDAVDQSIADEPELRSRLAVARLRALAMSDRRDEIAEAFTQAHELATRLGSPNFEANVLSVYAGQVALNSRTDADAGPMIERLAELEPDIDDGDIALHAIHDRMMYATLRGRFDQVRDLAVTMDRLQERSHSRFWRFIRANQEAMDAFYQGDLKAAEDLADTCLELADKLPEEDGAGIYGLRMFMIRREQDRLAAMAPMVRQVLARADADAIWTPGLALLHLETGATAEAAEVLEPVKARAFDLPGDAMWSTVMVMLSEAMVRLGDVEACRLLRDQIGDLAGSNIMTGSGLMCFGRADRYLGMLSLAVGDLDDAEESIGIALEADSAGESVLWSNESRLWMARVRRAKGHHSEADAMLAVVAEQASNAGLRRLERLAITDGAS